MSDDSPLKEALVMFTLLKREFAGHDRNSGKRPLGIKCRFIIEGDEATFQMWAMIGEQKFGHTHRERIANITSGDRKAIEIASAMIDRVKRQSTREAGDK